MRILAITNIYPSPGAPASGVFVEQQIKGLETLGVQVRMLFIDRRREGARSYYRMTPIIRRAVAEFNPDLIHVMYGGVMADQVTRLSGLPPVIVTFHGSDLLGENLSGLVRKLVSHYGVHCSRLAARRAAGVVVVARHLLQALPKEFQSSGPRVGNASLLQPSTLNPQPSNAHVRIIPCGIDLERFQPMNQTACRAQLGWETNFFHVLFATSGSDPVKRPWLARAAVERLVADGIRAELHVLSNVPNANVPLWINASDALLLTSLHEGSPTIVKEALACGLPVVSVDVGDVAERIDGIEGCYLAEPQPENLALKLRQVHHRSRVGRVTPLRAAMVNVGRVNSSAPQSAVYEQGTRIDGRAVTEELSHLASARKLKGFYDEILLECSRRKQNI